MKLRDKLKRQKKPKIVTQFGREIYDPDKVKRLSKNPVSLRGLINSILK